MSKDKHGANLFELSKQYNFEIEDLRDFASNINPIGPSRKSLDKVIENIDLITTYPDPEYIDLKENISKYVDANTEDIFLGSGTTQLLREYIEFINPKNSLILSPCYSEYENELNKLDGNIYYYTLKKENEFKIKVSELIECINTNEIDLFIFANPNNPTGTILNKEDIERILKNTDAKLLIDETYSEFTNQEIYSSVSLTKEYKNLFIARGVSKFFASPGIRLGYGITSDEETKQAFEKNEMLWNITILSDIMGQNMFSDISYITEVYNFIKSEREYMISELSRIEKLKIYNSEGNFVLCEILNEKTSTDLRSYLLKDAFIIRDCKTFRGLNDKYFRFCILNKEDNRKLLEKIKKYFD